MKKVSVSGYAVCEVIQKVEVEDNATEQEIREKAEEEFKGLEEYSDGSVGVSGNATIHDISDGEVNFTQSYNELVPAPIILEDTDFGIKTKYKSKEAREHFYIDSWKKQYPGRQYPTSPETATLGQAIKWNRDYILKLVHLVQKEYKDYPEEWYCQICIDNQNHDIYSTTFIKEGTDIKVFYKKATEIMKLYTEQLEHITDENVEKQVDHILDELH
jgi:hypothetical protein